VFADDAGWECEEDMSMKKAVGLWIDHRKAVIVAVTDQGETTSLIVSRVEKQRGRVAGVRSTTPFASRLVPADDRQERSFHEHLATYYDAVIASVRDAESILIFGPGEAKVELKHRLTNDTLGGRIVGLETEDKMTDRQIEAKVRQYFAPHPSTR
jgi:hypothetical protein